MLMKYKVGEILCSVNLDEINGMFVVSVFVSGRTVYTSSHTNKRDGEDEYRRQVDSWLKDSHDGAAF